MSQTSSLVLRIPSSNSWDKKGPAQQGLLTTKDAFPALCPGSVSEVRRNQNEIIALSIWAYPSLPPTIPQSTPNPPKREKKAMIRTVMMNTAPQIILSVSREAMTKEKYFLISLFSFCKTGPDTYTASESHWQPPLHSRPIHRSVHAQCSPTGEGPCSRRQHHPHLAVKTGPKRWASKTQTATTHGGRRARTGEAEKEPERPLVAAGLPFLHCARRKAEPLASTFHHRMSC